MDNRYLFRGKSLYNVPTLDIKAGSWVYGAYHNNPKIHKTMPSIFVSSGGSAGWLEIDPVTVGQCTGLKDKNGRLIFEGDVCRFIFGLKDDKRDFVGIIEYVKEDDFLGLRLRWLYCTGDGDPCAWPAECLRCWHGSRNFEITGNVHDSPELLEGAWA